MECEHKITGHRGKINQELPGYWGIYWYGGKEGQEHAKIIREKGLLPFWNKKEDIKIIT